jgi:hypothetical protein
MHSVDIGRAREKHTSGVFKCWAAFMIHYGGTIHETLTFSILTISRYVGEGIIPYRWMYCAFAFYGSLFSSLHYWITFSPFLLVETGTNLDVRIRIEIRPDEKELKPSFYSPRSSV